MPKSNLRSETSLDPASKGKTGHAVRRSFAALGERNPGPVLLTARIEESVQNQPFGGDKRHPQSVEVKRFTKQIVNADATDRALQTPQSLSCQYMYKFDCLFIYKKTNATNWPELERAHPIDLISDVVRVNRFICLI